MTRLCLPTGSKIGPVLIDPDLNWESGSGFGGGGGGKNDPQKTVKL